MKRTANILYCLTIPAIIVSCATPKTITESHVDTEIKTNTDSIEAGSKIVVQQHAESKEENNQHSDSTSSSQTSIIAELTFVPEGGTYNPRTGDLTGIRSAKLQADINKMDRTIKDQHTQIATLNDSITTLQDSLVYYKQQATIISKEDIHEEKESAYKQFWMRFFVICTILFWLLISIIIAKTCRRILRR